MTSATVQPVAFSALLDWYVRLTPQALDDIPRFYVPDAHFTDPFNDVRGYAAIRLIFEHMFEVVDAPRFQSESQILGRYDAFATWTFTGSVRGAPFCVPGSTHLCFGDDGRVVTHRDYWDAATLWRQLPMIGGPVRLLQRRFAAPVPQ